jgi:hypothetical protein
MELLDDKRVTYAVLVIGVIGVLISLLIDPLRGQDFHLGTVQIIVLIVGIVLVLAGAYLSFVRKPPAA